MKRKKADGYFRETAYGHEVIWNQVKYVFSDKFPVTKKDKKERKKTQKTLYLFASTKREGANWLKKNKVPEMKHLPSHMFNNNFSKMKSKFISTDIDGAYWDIAHQLGIINQITYHAGNLKASKATMLAALANLGSDKYYKIIKKGIVTNNLVVVKGSDKLKEVYKYIRYVCFKHMQECARLLGNDFYEYKTDCIYYVKSTANQNLVESYLDTHGLEFKSGEAYFEKT